MLTFVELKDIASLDLFIGRSSQAPVIIFKHSNACGISGRAHAQMAGVDGQIGIVTVQESRSVSNEIERRLGVAHETPQVLIIHDGRVVWSASHGQIRTEVVSAALLSIG